MRMYCDSEKGLGKAGSAIMKRTCKHMLEHIALQEQKAEKKRLKKKKEEQKREKDMLKKKKKKGCNDSRGQ